ncbi:MAG TPA: hypothetical protein VLM42_18285 [Bryobacteraceae bacterium]|nr:hypothetical protein [Bryobacteraceae bacterium]
MRRTNLLRIVIFGVLAVGASAQVGGPVMGYLPDNGALRTLYGIPASGWVGDAIGPDRALSLIEMSPDQSRALAIAADTGALMLLTPATGVTAHVNGAASGADRIVFSPSGTAAALWFPANNHVQVVSGLAAAPSVRDIDASFLGGDPLGLAVSDDGQWVAGAWSSNVYAFGPAGDAAALPVAGLAEALCFFHGRADVAVITASQVVIVSDIGGAVVPNVIYTKPGDSASGAPVEVAVGFAVSFDNRYLAIAGNLGSLATFDLTAGSSAGGNCNCTPSGLAGMGGSLFRVTGVNDGALKVFDASTNDVWFLPLAAPVTASATAGGQQ